MPSGRMPTASEILEVMDWLERNPDRRGELSGGYDIFRACVADIAAAFLPFAVAAARAKSIAELTA